MTDDSKIIVDDDWKAQAQAEKQKLAEEVEQQQAQAAEQQKIPEASFSALANLIGTQAMMSLQGMQDPAGSGKMVVDPAAAKYFIDTLVVLTEKTEGNPSEEEATHLKQITGDLQMAFVEMMKHLESQGAPGTAAPAEEAAAAPKIETDV